MDLVSDVVLLGASSPWLLLIVFAAAAIDGFFPPVPSETVLVAGVAVAASKGAFVTVLLLCAVAAIGAMIGDNTAYAIGRKIGTSGFAWMRRPKVSAAFARAHSALERRGAPLILGARYIPVGRVAVNMSAGALAYPWRRFLPLSVVGAVSWAVYSAIVGTVAGHWLEGQPLLSAVLGVAFALIIGVIVDRIVALRRRAASSTPRIDSADSVDSIKPVEPDPVHSAGLARPVGSVHQVDALEPRTDCGTRNKNGTVFDQTLSTVHSDDPSSAIG